MAWKEESQRAAIYSCEVFLLPFQAGEGNMLFRRRLLRRLLKRLSCNELLPKHREHKRTSIQVLCAETMERERET